MPNIRPGQSVGKHLSVSRQLDGDNWELTSRAGNTYMASSSQISSRLQASAISAKLAKTKTLKFKWRELIKTLHDWAQIYQHPPLRLLDRIERGMTIEQALFLPTHSRYLIDDTDPLCLHIPNDNGKPLCNPKNHCQKNEILSVQQTVCPDCINLYPILGLEPVHPLPSAKRVKAKSSASASPKDKTQAKESDQQDNKRLKKTGELTIDLDKYEQLKQVNFVFRERENVAECWNGYLPSDLTNPVVSDIVTTSTGFKWNCYQGAEAPTRNQVARLVLASIQD